jgi:hypothetical protein
MEAFKFCMSCVGKRRAGDVVGRCEKEKDNGEEGARVDLRRTFRIFLTMDAHSADAPGGSIAPTSCAITNDAGSGLR